MYKSILEYRNDDNYSNYPMRPTIIIKKKEKLYKKMFASKWANLKLFLKERKSLESSVKLQKINTIDQFASKCEEIYKKKVEILLLTKKNRQMFKSFNSTSNYIIDKDIQEISRKISKIKVLDASKHLESISNYLTEFLFAFRTNNDLMLRLIEGADKEQYEILVPFLCHFFYENFYMENTEQEEILYIIYLLLEKEIDSLFTPSVTTFLEQSFVSNFLTEMGNRYEIKHYIDIILNDLIMRIEESNITYNSMDIISNQTKNNEGIFYDMLEEDSFTEKFTKYRHDTINTNIKKRKVPLFEEDNIMKRSVAIGNENNFTLRSNAISISDLKNTSNYSSKTPLKKDINEDLFNDINEKFIRKKLKEEKDEIMKHFYVRQLRKLQAAKNSDLFNGNKFYDKLKKENKIYKSSVEEFNKSYHLIINFINDLLSNLENNTIIPYSIKVICKFIYQLLMKRFKNITKIQCNILICRYLFDKLIFPVLQNPDINDVGKDMIVSFNTRKTLNNIYDVCKKLVRGELFSINDRDCFVIFNKFIINNFHRINDIIDKIIHVKEPGKLKLLSEQFYSTEDFNLDNLKRSYIDINYDYFQENPNDFMQHRSICFSKKELLVFYDIIDRSKERFEEIQDSFEQISKIKESEIDNKMNDDNYYMIISDEYDEEINELLNHEESKITIRKEKNNEIILLNIKSCIEYVINNVEIFPNWKWVNENWDTLKTFQFIHTYLTTYNLDSRNYLKNQEGKIPLSWYSLYIINNLKKIKSTFNNNDYENLYESLKTEITDKLKKLRKLNNFLTINMSTKFILIDHKIKIFDQELENVKKTELSIKTVQFIENTKIKVCLTTVDDLLEMSKYISGFHDHLDIDSENKFILVIRSKKTDKTEKNECIHKTKLENRIYQKDKKKIKKMHCKNINQFCFHFAEYYQIICQDIIKGQTQTPTQSSINIKSKYKQSCSKEVVEMYMNNLTNVIKQTSIFDNEEDRQKALHIIWNYILKNLCIKICENGMNEKDKFFRTICKKLSWIQPENLDIPKEVFNSTLFKKAEFHIKKMDNLRTPGGMLDQFGLGVQLINSMFVFMMNQQHAEAGDLLPLIIYGIINSKPKRMIFNIKFIKYFMSENQLLGNIGYNLIQAESSTNYIQNLRGKQLKMDEEEFDKRCEECMSINNFNKSINDDSDW